MKKYTYKESKYNSGGNDFGIAFLILFAIIGGIVLVSIFIQNAASDRLASLPCEDVPVSEKTPRGKRPDCDPLYIVGQKIQSIRQEQEATHEEIRKKKESGEVCLSEKEAWQNIGRTTCVVYQVGYLVTTTQGYVFLNEKQGYKSGFVAAILTPSVSNFEHAKQNYLGRNIAVSGTITAYEGHPQIIVSSLSQITEPKYYGLDALDDSSKSYGIVYTK